MELEKTLDKKIFRSENKKFPKIDYLEEKTDFFNLQTVFLTKKNPKKKKKNFGKFNPILSKQRYHLKIKSNSIFRKEKKSSKKKWGKSNRKGILSKLLPGFF